MPADFPWPQTAAPTREKAAPALAWLQKSFLPDVYKTSGEQLAAMTANVNYLSEAPARSGKNPIVLLGKGLYDQYRNLTSPLPLKKTASYQVAAGFYQDQFLPSTGAT